jgi:hypothetical protein
LRVGKRGERLYYFTCGGIDGGNGHERDSDRGGVEEARYYCMTNLTFLQ